MKALTICQPFARLIVVGEKRVENRTWPTGYRGWLAIHAGKSLKWLRGEKPTPDMAFGAVVGLAKLVDCLDFHDIVNSRHDEKYPWLKRHEHMEGPWCWILSDVVRLNEPVPYRGQLGLFDISLPLPPNAENERRSE
jgi:hypothetical protein